MQERSRLYDAFRKRLDAFAEQLPGIEEDRVDALHGARVATRRLREIVPLLQLERSVTRKLGRRMKKVTHTLGAVRELDVLCALVAELARAHRSTPAALNVVLAAIEEARDQARKRLMARSVPTKMKRLAARLERSSGDLPWRDKK